MKGKNAYRRYKDGETLTMVDPRGPTEIEVLRAALADQDLQWIGIQACPDNKCTACVNVATMQRRKIAEALAFPNTSSDEDVKR